MSEVELKIKITYHCNNRMWCCKISGVEEWEKKRNYCLQQEPSHSIEIGLFGPIYVGMFDVRTNICYGQSRLKVRVFKN